MGFLSTVHDDADRVTNVDDDDDDGKPNESLYEEDSDDHDQENTTVSLNEAENEFELLDDHSFIEIIQIQMDSISSGSYKQTIEGRKEPCFKTPISPAPSPTAPCPTAPRKTKGINKNVVVV